jgi:hypothetical protein
VERCRTHPGPEGNRSSAKALVDPERDRSSVKALAGPEGGVPIVSVEFSSKGVRIASCL